MRSEMIAHLKDQLQEMKAKTSMEKKYIKKVCTVSVSQTQKMCNMSEKELKDEIEVNYQVGSACLHKQLPSLCL